MQHTEPATDKVYYNDWVVKQFLIATFVWGAAALLVGVIIATQLADWRLNFGLPWLTFGRLRPLHTNAAIFAFAGNAIFAGIYHSTQRLVRARVYSDFLSKVHFWGWQLVILLALVTLPLGYTVGKEYAELEWPIDILITIVWTLFAVNFFATLKRRKERHLYVAIWFYIATIVTVAILHVVNSLAIPVSALHSYPIYAGVQDALVQWWYGHNAVAFFLTTPFLGLMYYYVPKAVNRPIYSYRLSIIHFWALVFIYIWAGPHHLLYSALPAWAQTLGIVFSVMLIAPSWGGMINGLLTLRGAWNRIKTDPILKFFVAALTFYGMSTFEGPLMSVKSVNALAHFTDWIIAHVHGGTLGWNGFMIFAMSYYLIPKLWKTKLYSTRLATTHFWIATIGIALYIVSMWTAGITQGLMWRGIDSGRLLYPDFLETVVRIVPLYYVRAIGGILYLAGYVLFLYNILRTIAKAPQTTEESYGVSPRDSQSEDTGSGHRFIESLGSIFTILVIYAVLVGSVFELVPALDSHRYLQPPPELRPYSPLELAGRDIYIREGCYTCHSQMVRPIASEVMRYGAQSRPEEYLYDHPFQWGSKRTGPDLSRVGGKYPDLWHYRHMIDPRSINPGSIMPGYTWLATTKLDYLILGRKLTVMKALGVPYHQTDIYNAVNSAQSQADQIATDLIGQGVSSAIKDKEILALIAYLQRLKALPEKGDAGAAP